MKKIIFGDNALPVADVYPFRYQNGKTVLRITCDDSVTSEAIMKLLESNTEPIDYYEGEELKITYRDYTSGDYSASYRNGIYSCEIAKTDAYKIQIEQNTADIEYLMLMTE